MGPLPAMGLAALGIFDAAVHAFTAALQGVVTAGVGEVLPVTSPIAPAGRVAALLLLHLRFACRWWGGADLPPIWEEVARVKEITEGLATLNHTLPRGVSLCQRVFRGRAHFGASLPLLEFVKNV